jgi:hypothetical protein
VTRRCSRPVIRLASGILLTSLPATIAVFWRNSVAAILRYAGRAHALSHRGRLGFAVDLPPLLARGRWAGTGEDGGWAPGRIGKRWAATPGDSVRLNSTLSCAAF